MADFHKARPGHNLNKTYKTIHKHVVSIKSLSDRFIEKSISRSKPCDCLWLDSIGLCPFKSLQSATGCCTIFVK